MQEKLKYISFDYDLNCLYITFECEGVNWKLCSFKIKLSYVELWNYIVSSFSDSKSSVSVNSSFLSLSLSVFRFIFLFTCIIL